MLNGMSTIVKSLSKNVKVLLSHPVTDIIHSIDDSGNAKFIIKATTPSASTQFEAKKVVVSVPLGSLKKGFIRFQPELPVTKRRAIRRMGFGA